MYFLKLVIINHMKLKDDSYSTDIVNWSNVSGVQRMLSNILITPRTGLKFGNNKKY